MRSNIQNIKIKLYSIYFFIKKTFNTIYYIIKYKGDFILVDAWIEQWFGKLVHRNLGDELNVYLIESLTGKKVLNCRNTILTGNRFLLIGSIVETHMTSKSIVWGSGVMYGNRKIIKPKSVFAVRGKYTREVFLRNQIECPKVYGDPALLLPYVYNPEIKKKFKYGLIPHVADLNNNVIQTFLTRNKDNVTLISFKNYNDWHNVIDQIKSCENIISSSLHGLIISDAYGIPNVWIKVSNLIKGNDFKYKDYFSGVNRKYEPPVLVTYETLLQDIDLRIANYKRIEFDLESLIKASPLALNIPYND